MFSLEKLHVCVVCVLIQLCEYWRKYLETTVETCYNENKGGKKSLQ